MPSALAQKTRKGMRWNMERIQLFVGRLMTVKLADLKGEEGQGVTEYGIVLAFVAVALAAVLVALGSEVPTSVHQSRTDLGNRLQGKQRNTFSQERPLHRIAPLLP